MNQFISETLKGKTYIDPRTDTGFKSLFASKDAIKDFVDGILQLKGDGLCLLRGVHYLDDNLTCLLVEYGGGEQSVLAFLSGYGLAVHRERQHVGALVHG